MGHVTVSEEMRARILQKVDLSGRDSGTKAVPFSRWKRYAAAAACAVAVLVCALAMPQILSVYQNRSAADTMGSDTPLTGSQADVTCRSAKELTGQIGFPVTDLTTLPFEKTAASYHSLFGEIAEIIYTGPDGQSAVFRKSAGTEDNSGVYDTFSDTGSISVGKVKVTLKGNGTQFTLASWTDGTYAYSVVLSEGVGKDIWKTVIEGIGG